VQADRVLAAVRKLFNWYAARDDEFRSPIVRGMARTKPRERARQRILSDDEIRAFWFATGHLIEDNDAFASIARMLLLSAQRLREVANMKRTELADGEWMLPAARSKNKNPNHVPLSAAALEIVAAQPPRGGYVFRTVADVPFSGFSKGKARLDALMLEKLSTLAAEGGNAPLAAQVSELNALYMSAKEDPKAGREFAKCWWVTHDLRRTAKTLMIRAGVRPDISERVLGHVISGVEGVYDRHSYLNEKRDALERLSAIVNSIVNPVSRVVSIGLRRRA
jgi:integrase